MRSVLVLAGTVTVASAVLLGQAPVNSTAQGIGEFKKRVQAYVDLRSKVSNGLAQLKPGATPAEILAAEQLLGDRIRLERSSAVQGDIFLADVVPFFKKVFADYNARRSGRELRLVLDEVPNFKPQVNATYPPSQPKGTFPPRIAIELPQLPDGLEYRLVGSSLVLRDLNANLIVDWIPEIMARPKAQPASQPGQTK